ncbi:putative non-transporter ABC protein [Cavenderia fasciculata]|uniref:Non-transporter ABC protein n=1 Tax=Cavenderia fasciculata TaxID=261658 RepID=F4QF78_CACFS|nr:putative non-transporter ABC protein [Cavenderia fasciculata]EGG14232.1 putative non-transporter ABC protein [Cavenderia fasciculata]|eukprot:XP_004350941.1 putative non-transporter ABC protein [Cavenderia fasciculata]
MNRLLLSSSKSLSCVNQVRLVNTNTTTNVLVGQRNYSSSSNKPSTEWKKLLFTDLHVSSKTLDRTIDVLSRVRDLSTSKGLPVVFLGDFWHQRNIVQVRHIDALLKEFDRWKKDGVDAIFIPGNHDQVSVDGIIHGIEFFRLFDNIQVATDPIINEQEKCAYLPWRESNSAQNQLFKDLVEQQGGIDNAKDWTVFAHAELKGATSNGGYLSSGKVDASLLSSLRATYCGHYHKRQLIGNNSWYIGSPYQQNFGEMNDPHGVAIVSSHSIQPQFINFDDTPKHWRLTYPQDFKSTLSLSSKVQKNDIVEIRATKESMKSNEFINTLESLPPLLDIRRVMINQESNNNNNNSIPSSSSSSSSSTSSTFSTTFDISKLKEKYNNNHKSLDDFIIEYVKLKQPTLDSINNEEMVKKGMDVLDLVKDTMIRPMGRKVSIKEIEVTDFCSITGPLTLSLSDYRMLMIRGQMGSGKSSLFESMVWAIYGNTSPRKQASSSSSIKGDEVINDRAKMCKVTVRLQVDGRDISITRSKTRGKGAKVEINGLDATLRQGVSDQQSLINNIIGLDYDLFRMCVYMGQGSISNFVTDSDRRRKELLSRAFSLGLCIPAHKIAKEQRKKQENLVTELETKLNRMTAQLSTWTDIDYEESTLEWDSNRQTRVKRIENQLEKEKRELEELDIQNNLKKQQQQEIQEQRDELLNDMKHLDLERKEYQEEYHRRHTMTHKRLFNNEFKVGNINKEIAELQKSKKHLEKHSKQGLDNVQCGECGQLIDQSLQLTKMETLQQRVKEKQSELADLDNQKLSIDQEIDALNLENRTTMTGFGKTSERINASLQQLKIQEGNFGYRIEFSQRTIEDLTRQKQALENEVNPFESQSKARMAQIDKLQQDSTNLQNNIETESRELDRLVFWERAFGSDGISVMVLNSVVKEIENYANEYLSILSKGKLFTSLSISNTRDENGHDDIDNGDLSLQVYEIDDNDKGRITERSFYSLSGGQRRCVELSYSPFALSEVIFNHVGSRITTLVVDELTNHLDQTIKPVICDLLRNHLKEKDSIVVIDHDQSVQSEFDNVLNLQFNDLNNKHQFVEI